MTATTISMWLKPEGRVVRLSGFRAEIAVDGLKQPYGITVSAGKLYVVDVDTKDLIERDLATGAFRNIASNLPVGAPVGVASKRLSGVAGFCGPMTSMWDSRRRGQDALCVW